MTYEEAFGGWVCRWSGLLKELAPFIHVLRIDDESSRQESAASFIRQWDPPLNQERAAALREMERAAADRLKPRPDEPGQA